MKPLLLIPLLAQLSVAPSVGEGNTAPAIGETPPPAEVNPEPEPKPEPVAVQADPQPVEPPKASQAPINIPVPEPLAEDSVDLAPPLEQPALEENEQRGNVPPPPSENPTYDPHQPQAVPYPQEQAQQPMHEGTDQRPSTQPKKAPAQSAVAYRQQTLPSQPPARFTTETIG